MKQSSILFCLTFLCVTALASPGKANSVRITDDLGRTVVLDKPAARVVPLYGAFTEMLYAIGAGPQVFARTQADQFPPQILDLPSVGTHMRPNIEMILGLKPDLVLQSATRNEEAADLERLQSSGIPIVVFAPRTFQEIFSTMERMGILTGREEEARDAVEGLRGRLGTLRNRLGEGTKPLKVFFEVRADPLSAAGQGSIVQEILTAAGAENVLASPKAIVQYSFENLLLDDPDVYIVQHGPMNRNPQEPAKRVHYSQLRAVSSGRVIFVDEFIFSRPGPRCVDAAEELASKLYPEKFQR